MAKAKTIEEKILYLQDIYYKWVKNDPMLKIDIDAMEERIGSLNNTYLVFLKKTDKLEIKGAKEAFRNQMNFLTGIDEKILQRNSNKMRSEIMNKRILGSEY